MANMKHVIIMSMSMDGLARTAAERVEELTHKAKASLTFSDFGDFVDCVRVFAMQDDAEVISSRPATLSNKQAYSIIFDDKSRITVVHG